MLKYYNYDIVFQEIPDELTLAVNISNCPNRCEGCHSPHLQSDIGEHLNQEFIDFLLNKYGSAISCFCFMGGDNMPHEIARLARHIRQKYAHIKTAWYSGREKLPQNVDILSFQYLKLGGYIEDLGGLNNKNTNQRFYQIQENGEIINITNVFQKNEANN